MTVRDSLFSFDDGAFVGDIDEMKFEIRWKICFMGL